MAQGNKLEDLRVERVDGVDRPATGHRWMIVKSEEKPSEVEKDYAALSKTALEALLKEEGLQLGDEAVEALKALATALEVDFPVEKADEEPEAPAAAAEEDVEKDEEKPEADAPVTHGELEGAIEKALRSIFDTSLDDDEATPAPTARLTKASSKQPKGQDDGEVITKGTGLFEDVIFEQ